MTQQEQFTTDDKRYKSLLRAMKRFDYQSDALLEVLNVAQETYGFLSQELLINISDQLSVPITQVYGVATFYHMFSFEPLGEHNCIVCDGTACHVKGSTKIIDALSEEFKVSPGETTEDGKFSLSIARCVGSCGLAPVVVMDGQVHGKEEPETLARRITDSILQEA
jgi:bidirectional [NiFe] hydrogenase diaphorase subunit